MQWYPHYYSCWINCPVTKPIYRGSESNSLGPIAVAVSGPRLLPIMHHHMVIVVRARRVTLVDRIGIGTHGRICSICWIHIQSSTMMSGRYRHWCIMAKAGTHIYDVAISLNQTWSQLNQLTHQPHSTITIVLQGEASVPFSATTQPTALATVRRLFHTNWVLTRVYRCHIPVCTC